MQPSKSQTADSAWDLSLRLGEMVFSCTRCAVVEKLCYQLEGSQEEMSRLHSIRGDEKETYRFFSETQQPEEP